MERMRVIRARSPVIPVINFRRSVVRFIGKYPFLYYSFAALYPDERGRVVKRGLTVNRGTQLVIEGFPRSANSFSVIAFKQAQKEDVRMAHHAHTPAQIIRAAQGIFEDVIEDYGAVIQRVNTRFETQFSVFEHTTDNVKAVFARIEEINRTDGKGLESQVARPSAMRDKLKNTVKNALETKKVRSLINRAEALYRDFIDYPQI